MIHISFLKPVVLKTNTIEEENLLNSLDKSKVDYRYVDTFDEYLAQTPPEFRPHLVNSYPSNKMMLLYTFGVVFFRKYNFSEDVENLVFGLFVVNLLLFIPLFFWKKYTSVIALFMFGIYLILVFLGKSPFILVDICFLFVFTYLFYKRHDKMIKLY